MKYRGRHTQHAGRLGAPAAAACLFITLIAATDAFGQAHRPDRGFYASSRIGLSVYDGDNNERVVPVFGAANGSSHAFSVGGGYYLSARWSVGLEFKSGNYPHVAINPRDSRYYTQRHTAQISARYLLLSAGTIAPYATAGLHVTRGARIPEHITGAAPKDPTAFGPMLGAGVDVAINDRISLIVEARGNLSFPDQGFDAVSGASGADLFGFIGTGIRVNLQRGARPIRISIAGPEEIEAGSNAAFVAAARSGSAEPTHYEWNLGDGTLAEGPAVDHAFFQPGTYTVTLNARNRRDSDTAVLSITVNPVRVEDVASPGLILEAEAECTRLLEEAESAYVMGRFSEAIDTVDPCFEEPLVSSSARVRAHRIRTLAYASDGAHLRAREEVERLLDVDPGYEPDPVQDPPSYTSMISIARQQRAGADAQLGQQSSVSAAYYILPARVLAYADDLTLTESQRAELLAVSDVVSDVEQPLLAALDEDRTLLSEISDSTMRQEISDRVQRAERQLRALYRNAQQQVLLVLTAEQRTRFNQLSAGGGSAGLR